MVVVPEHAPAPGRASVLENSPLALDIEAIHELELLEVQPADEPIRQTVAETKVTPAGKTSVIVTPVADAVPWLDTPI